jgi:hypothetical protein
MQPTQKHLGQSFGMVLLFAVTCVGLIAMMSRFA